MIDSIYLETIHLFSCIHPSIHQNQSFTNWMTQEREGLVGVRLVRERDRETRMIHWIHNKNRDTPRNIVLLTGMVFTLAIRRLDNSEKTLFLTFSFRYHTVDRVPAYSLISQWPNEQFWSSRMIRYLSIYFTNQTLIEFYLMTQPGVFLCVTSTTYIRGDSNLILLFTIFSTALRIHATQTISTPHARKKIYYLQVNLFDRVFSSKLTLPQCQRLCFALLI